MASDNAQSTQIPVIDISPGNADAPQQLLDAAVRIGFIFVANNDDVISPNLIQSMFKISEEFFALPQEIKEEVSISSNKAGKNFGWLSQGVEKLDPATQKRPDVKEAFNLSLTDRATGAFDQPLPALFQQHAASLAAFQHACHALCQRLLALLAAALQLDDPAWFTARHDLARGHSSAILRLLYYPQRGPAPAAGGGSSGGDSNGCAESVAPPASAPEHDDLRAGAHSDYGSLTCLFQLPGQPGLEIRTPEGAWAAVPVDPAAESSQQGAAAAAAAAAADDDDRPLPILVNIGDLLEDWTGGLLKSTVHRVVFPRATPGSPPAVDRYSMAYFCHPLDDALIEPVPSRVVDEHVRAHPRKTRTDGRVITARDHLMERLAATYTIK